MMLKHEKYSQPDCCCEDMREALSDNEHPLYYSSTFDEYGLTLSSKFEYSILINCPWCATKLPSSKRDAWMKELDEQNIDPWESDIPVQYLSAAWWKSSHEL